jgi:hypothetical protein
MLKMMPVARRVLGENDDTTLKMRQTYAQTLHNNDSATLDDFHESVETLEETARTARRAFGGSHPTVVSIEKSLRIARAALDARHSCQTRAAPAAEAGEAMDALGASADATDAADAAGELRVVALPPGVPDLLASDDAPHRPSLFDLLAAARNAPDPS